MTGSGEMILKNMFAWMLFSVEQYPGEAIVACFSSSHIRWKNEIHYLYYINKFVFGMPIILIGLD
jgi:hypothetical protein